MVLIGEGVGVPIGVGDAGTLVTGVGEKTTVGVGDAAVAALSTINTVRPPWIALQT
jgi:hypothetical protein